MALAGHDSCHITPSSLLRIAITCLAMVCLAACQQREVDEVTLDQLARFQDDYHGRVIVTAGTLRTYPEPRHYWIEDEDLNRVAVAGRDDLAPLVGQRVAVRGLFRYDPEEGRAIDVEYLSPSP